MNYRPTPSEILSRPDVLDQLADIEHERWAHWQRFVHDNCQEQEDGSFVIPADMVHRWERQIKTPYSQLTEAERESDIEQVKRYLPTVIKVLG